MTAAKEAADIVLVEVGAVQDHIRMVDGPDSALDRDHEMTLLGR